MNTSFMPNSIAPKAMAPRFAASLTQKALDQGGKIETYDDIVILGGARTPFVKANQSAQNVTPFELMKIAMQGALDKTGVKAGEVNQLIMGNIVVNDEQTSFVPRQVAMALGLAKGTIASIANRVCGTGFEVARLAAHELVNGGDSIILTGGVENMTQAPVMDSQTWKTKPGPGQTPATMPPAKAHNYNPMVKALTDPGIGKVMFHTADELAVRAGVSRAEIDAFAADSHNKTDFALKQGKFQDEIVPIRQQDLTQGSLPAGTTEISKDEGLLRPGSTGSGLAKLKVLDQGRKDAVHSAASASGVVDGAAALILSTGKVAKEKNLNVLANLKAMAVTGCDPEIMGIGPARAIEEVLKASKLKLDDIDIVEVNEAFGGQTLSVVKQVAADEGYDYNKLLGKLNPDGGAIAIGHPLAATGSRIMLHSALELQKQQKKYAIVSACIGGGQGIAALIENPKA